MFRTAFLTVGLCLLAGCDGTTSRLKGELFENGQPVTFPPGAMPGVVLRPLDGQGRPSETVMYKSVVSPAGSFEWVGKGDLPSGGYQFCLELNGSAAERYKHLTPTASRTRIELTPGTNLLKIDIGKKE